MWINRDISQVILTQSKYKPAILLCGARQTGKSSLLKHLLPKAQIVSLDSTALASEAINSPESFLTKLVPPVIIDEVQYAPNLFRELKRLIDSNRSAVGQFFLTGSQKFSLMHGVSESLAGRISVIDIATCSAQEIRKSGISAQNLPQRGGFPELWVQTEQTSSRFFDDYITTYLERDLRTLLNVGSLHVFDRFLRALALRTAGLVNFIDIGREIGIAGNTVNRWIDALITGGIIYLLEPWYAKESQRLIKTPKLFFRDNGLLCYLLRINAPEFWKTHAMAGQIWENFVFCELLAFLETKELNRNIWFWRTKDGNEIDFVIETNGQIYLIEAKVAERPHIQGLWFNKFDKTHPQQQATIKIVACLQNEDNVINNKEFYSINPLLSSFDKVVGI